MDQWKRTESRNRSIQSLIFGKGAKAVQWNKDIFSSGARTTEHPDAKKNESRYRSYTFHKN